MNLIRRILMLLGLGRKEETSGTMSLQPGHDDYFKIAQKHLESGVYNICACGQDFPSLDAIRRFERQFSVRLPDDFVSFSISRIGGFRGEVKEEIWPTPQPGDVGPFWTMCYGLWVYGFARGIPEEMDIRAQTGVFRSETGTRLTPCLKVIGDADIYCFAEDGVLCRWDHETGEAPPVGQSFLEVFDAELAALAERKDRMVAQRQSRPPKT